MDHPDPLLTALRENRLAQLQQLTQATSSAAAPSPPPSVADGNADPDTRGKVDGRALLRRSLPRVRDWGTEQWMPLHVAADAGALQVVDWLLGQGVRPDCRTRFVTPLHARQTPLHLAAAAGHTAVVDRLLAAAAEVELHDAQRRSPLWLAVRHGHLAAAARLLARGADPQSRDAQGRPPLHAALLPPLSEAASAATTPADAEVSPGAERPASAWSPAPALLLLEHGADPHATCPKDPAGYTALHRCVALGPAARPVARALRAAGADPALADPRHHQTAADHARSRGDLTDWHDLLG